MADLIFLAGGGQNLEQSAIIPSVIMDVDHNMSNSLSSYPIEKTPDGTYNAVVKNNVINIRGAFSRIHLKNTSAIVAGVLDEELTAALGASAEDINKSKVVTRTAGNTTPDLLDEQVISNYYRPEAAFDLIKEARDKNTYMDVVTGFTIYKDCLIQNFNVREDKDTGGLMRFDLVLVQPRFTEVVNAIGANIVEEKSDDGTSPTLGTDATPEKKPDSWCDGALCEAVKTAAKSFLGSATGSAP